MANARLRMLWLANAGRMSPAAATISSAQRSKLASERDFTSNSGLSHPLALAAMVSASQYAPLTSRTWRGDASVPADQRITSARSSAASCL